MQQQIRSGDTTQQMHAIIKLRRGLQILACQSACWLSLIKLVPYLIQLSIQCASPQLQFESLWTLTNIFALCDSKEEKQLEQFLPKLMVLFSSKYVSIIRQFIQLLGYLSQSSHQKMHGMTIFEKLLEISEKHECMLLFERICFVYRKLDLQDLSLRQSARLQAKKRLFDHIFTRFINSQPISLTKTSIKTFYCNCVESKNWQKQDRQHFLMYLLPSILNHHNNFLSQLIRSPFQTRLTQQNHNFVRKLCRHFSQFAKEPLGNEILGIIQNQLKNIRIEHFEKTIRMQKKRQYLVDMVCILRNKRQQKQIANMILKSQKLLEEIFPYKNLPQNARQQIQILQKLIENGESQLIFRLIVDKSIVSMLMGVVDPQLMVPSREIVYKILVRAIQNKQSLLRNNILDSYCSVLKDRRNTEAQLRANSNESLQQVMLRLDFLKIQMQAESDRS